MKLENEFVVPVPRGQAWDVLMDVERIAPCMPGATFDGYDGDSFKGRVKVKLGPITVTYNGVAKFVESDREAGRAVIDAAGKEARGPGTANATITTVLVDQGATTLVKVATELNITGKPAQFGRGVMADVGNKLIGQFADCVSTRLNVSMLLRLNMFHLLQTVSIQGQSSSFGAEGVEAAEAAPIAPTAPTAPSEPAGPRKVVPMRQTEEAIDLLGTAGVPVAKRVLPVVGGLFALFVLWRLLRRARR